MTRHKASSRGAAVVAAEKKGAVEKCLATKVSWHAAAAAATQRAAANSPETPRAVVGAASMVPTRSSSRSRKMPAYLGEFAQSPARPSGVPTQALAVDDNGEDDDGIRRHQATTNLVMATMAAVADDDGVGG